MNERHSLNTLSMEKVCAELSPQCVYLHRPTLNGVTEVHNISINLSIPYRSYEVLKSGEMAPWSCDHTSKVSFNVIKCHLLILSLLPHHGGCP